MKNKCRFYVLLFSLFSLLSCTEIDIPVFPSFIKNVIKGTNYKIKTKDIIVLADDSAKQHAISTAFLLAIIKQESGFNAEAISKAGAIGLMQLMPATIYYINEKSSLTIDKPTNPYQNIRGGTWYLNRLYSKFLMYPDRWQYALSSYNCGLSCLKGAEKTALDNYEKQEGYRPAFLNWSYVAPYLPSETQNYVPAIFAHYKVYSHPKMSLNVKQASLTPPLSKGNPGIKQKILSIENQSNFAISLRDWKLKSFYGKEYKFNSRIIASKESMEIDNKIYQQLISSNNKPSKNKLSLINPEGDIINSFKF